MRIMVSVADVLRYATYSVDLLSLDNESDWFRLLADKVQDSDFDSLVDDIEKNGIIDPIVISFRDDDSWCIGNGHHRLTAAILLALDEIPVVFSCDYLHPESWSNEHMWNGRKKFNDTNADWYYDIIIEGLNEGEYANV